MFTNFLLFFHHAGNIQQMINGKSISNGAFPWCKIISGIQWKTTTTTYCVMGKQGVLLLLLSQLHKFATHIFTIKYLLFWCGKTMKRNVFWMEIMCGKCDEVKMFLFFVRFHFINLIVFLSFFYHLYYYFIVSVIFLS